VRAFLGNLRHYPPESAKDPFSPIADRALKVLARGLPFILSIMEIGLKMRSINTDKRSLTSDFRTEED
jgi:hypothetical protein